MRGHPITLLFSKKFGIEPKALDDAGLLDPFVDLDLPLFIDPLLLEKSTNGIISTQGIDAFRTHFEQFIRLLSMSEAEGDPAWKAAERHLSLAEPAENGLGYGRRGRSGSSRPARIRTQVLRTAKLIIKLGAKDPEMLSLMSFLEEEVGPDTISDLTSRAISEQLITITRDFCQAQKIPSNLLSNQGIPYFTTSKGNMKPMVLVPKDVVRHLPVTDTWDDVWAATEHNKALRDSVNKFLAGISQPTISDQKRAVRDSVLQSASVFDQFLAAVKASATAYDKNDDIFGYYKFRELIAATPFIKTFAKYDLSRGPEEVLKVVLDALDVFKHHVENGNLWEALWAGNTPKRERASQLIFYAIAEAHCRAHNVDVSGEPNMGGGPVDFKFSHGYNAKVLVEMKRSGGTVENGYGKQLEYYRAASQTDFAVFVVIDYGDGGAKISKIRKAQQLAGERGRRASEIVVVDARKKASASKRK